MTAGAPRPAAVEAFERAVVLSEAIAAVTRVRESLEQAAEMLAAADEDHVHSLMDALDTARSAAGGLLDDARAELRAANPS